MYNLPKFLTQFNIINNIDYIKSRLNVMPNNAYKYGSNRFDSESKLQVIFKST